jgi:2-keto-4-pentenoate hydratase/2-oxohepta-3-ene-1,7-dioic acid hydratase in catechol pathway
VNKSRYGLSEIISYASKDEWLLPTDLIGIGTVEKGSGFELEYYPKPNDKIELTLEGVGTLKNTFGTPQEEKSW